jgi:hypothetical protein
MQTESGQAGSRLTPAGRLTLAVALGLAAVVPALGWARPARAAATPTGATRAIPSPPNVGSTVGDGTEGKVAGMAIPSVNPQQSPNEVGRLHSDGLNTISLFVWWVQQNQDSNTIQPDYTDGVTETDADLELQMAATTNAGMKVILVPIFFCLKCEGEWRGTVSPSNPTLWWQSYQSFIDHYATIAQQRSASTLFIGSEMTSMEKYSTQWKSLIAEERGRYSGQIGYEENWDVIGQAQFLSDVDLIGVSAYFPLDDGAAPALSDILKDWSDSHASATSGKNWESKLAAVASATGKPILFGEVGYMSSDHAGRQPFLNYYDTTDWQLQSDLYQAVLQTFEDKPWWAGVVWWAWDVSNDSTSDDGRSPRGKTAEDLMRGWYAKGERPPDPSTPLVYSLPQYSQNDAEVPRSTPASGGGVAPGGAPSSGSHPASPTAGAGAQKSTAAAHSAVGSRQNSGPATPGAAAAGASPAAAVPGSTTGHSSGSRRTAAIVASIVLVLVILALAVVGALRRPESEKAATRPGGRAA